MRWLILTDDFPPLDGGVATWTAAVARGLHDAGHDVDVLARARPGVADQPFRVTPVYGRSFGRYGAWWTAARAWRRLRRADRVLASTWTVARGVAATCRRLGIPLHVAFHGSDLTRSRPDARVLEGAHLWTVSDYLRGLLDRPATVLPTPVDPSEPAPSTAPDHWVMVGRATPLKGGDRFVRLVAAAGARGTVIGDGPELQAWRALANDLGADVTFTGRLPHAEVLRRLPSFDLACLLPRADTDGTGAEGLGLSLIEAAAAGVPVVGCPTGGVPEAVGPGLVLRDPDDSEVSAKAIRDWWTPARGEEAHRWVGEGHGVQRTIAALCAVRLLRPG